MRRVKKPNFCVKEIVCDCAESLRDSEKKQCIIAASDVIDMKSQEYDVLAENQSLSQITEHDIVACNVTKNEMVYLYDKKFVARKEVRSKYYDKIMVLTNGICPICNLGHVRNLDHYLPKTLFPTYAVTPYNLLPICRDCNFDKKDYSFQTDDEATLHPYYDEIDNTIWLQAELQIVNDGIVVSYSVNEKSADEFFIHRCINHMKTYKLNEKYSIEAAREISDNILMWKKELDQWGEDEFLSFINEIISSLESVHKNSWKVALYRALANNVEILNDI